MKDRSKDHTPEPNIRVHRPGTLLHLGRIRAVVQKVTIDASLGVLYQVVHWDGSDRKEVWISPLEITGSNEEPLVIGFIV